MWWFVVISITTADMSHVKYKPPLTFGTYAECQHFIDRALDRAPPLKEKATIAVWCDDMTPPLPDEGEADE